MNISQHERFNSAVNLARSGHKILAFERFQKLENELPGHPDILFWMVYASADLTKAQSILRYITTFYPAHPMLPTARQWLSKKVSEETPIHPPIYKDSRWRFPVNGVWHELELKSEWWRGLSAVYLDGRLIKTVNYMENSWFWDVSDHEFQIDGQQLIVRQTCPWVKYKYDVILNGYFLRNGERASVAYPIPEWAWIFIWACMFIITTIRGIIPSAIGGGGAYLCAKIARNPDISVGSRVRYCLGIYALCWLGVFGSILFISLFIGIFSK
jgi:hypothetical protein